MNSYTVVGIIQLAQGVLRLLAQKEAGVEVSWEDLLLNADLTPFGLSDQENELVEYTRLGLRYLNERKIVTQEIVLMIQEAEEDGGRLDTTMVEEYLLQNGVELDDTQRMIDERKEQEA